jgi:PAS domain S-box-containing protein
MEHQDWQILLIEDDEDDFLLTRSALSEANGRKIILEWAPSYEEGRQCLCTKTYHAVLVDYDLGAESGITLISEFTARGYPSPLILYTGRGSYEVDLQAMQAGATLYLTKSETTPLLLERSIRYAIERKQIEAELRSSNAQLAIELAQRKRAEQKASEAEEQYRMLFDNMTEGFAVHEVILDDCGKPCDYRFLHMNPAFERLTGISREAAIGKRLYEVLPDSDTFWVETYGKVGQTGESVHFERYAGNLNRWYDVHAFQTSPDHFAVLFSDITERKRVEEEYRASEERLSLAIEGAGMATWDADLLSGRTIWSKRHFELFGYPASPDGLAGMEMWRSLVHPDDWEYLIAEYEKARRDHGLFTATHRIIRANDGKHVWIREFGRFSYDREGKPVRFVGVLFDDTPLQEAVQFIDAGSLTSRQPELPPEKALRQTGIEVIGPVPWGTHFCQFYSSRQDLIETLVPYFRAGLEANEFCMWITSEPLHVKDAEAALKEAMTDFEVYQSRGQLEILDYTQWYTRSGCFDSDTVLQGWNDKLAAAIQKGFTGLRLTGNTFWLEESTWNDFKHYEEKINEVILGQPMLALCTYAVEKCGAHEILDVVANHEFALIKNEGRWEIIESAGHLKIEQALRESEERLRLAVWAAELGVFQWDIVHDKAIWENSRMYEIFGQAPQDGSVNKAGLYQGIIHPDDQPAVEAALEEGQQPGHLFHVTCRIWRRSDGELRWTEFSGRVERDEQGNARFLSGVVEDITERKQAETRLEERNLRLQSYAEQLRRSNQALDEFAYIASHDLQEPLRKILAFGDLLKSRSAHGLDQQGQDYIERMQKAAQRMNDMLEGLLAYARVSSKGKTFSNAELTQIAYEVLSDLEGRIVQTGGEVQIEPLPVIQADPLQMRQLLQNLIGNALKFHRTGTAPQVRVTWKQLSADKIAVIVADNGIGFDNENVTQLFKPFHRLQAKVEYEGSGLGLAICKKIAERHGGAIYAEGKPGEGARFTVEICTNLINPN